MWILSVLEKINSKKQREHQRIKNEDQRLQNEDQRLQNEDQRLQNEDQRLQNEDQRLQNEDQKIQIDDQRLQREKQRLQNEDQRIKEECQTLLLKEKRILGSVNVTLDADSAHPHLSVSCDGKQVRDALEKHELVKNRDKGQNNRFDECLGVLGNRRFSSGCFYYEVKVKGLNVWYVGVARESVNRKGRISLSPQYGYWTMGKINNIYWACEDPRVCLSLTVNPERIGVFVDCKKGRVSFYDVKSMCYIYSFTAQSFTEKLHPFVSLGYDWYENSSSPLVICSDLS
ncbi:butyrophilin subfamily 2 member A2-like [Triplophysa rosa]|uniref:butyrophilin subfamily 2 member A2-like n=1 Tax=Triplophysa rosa TaxID=992332 RepID=UPI0025461131|nr:butyrophilin subfamily 2 member A2-like [Triplophysa rosa]